MMKRLLYVFILALWVASFTGCSDSGGGSDALSDFRATARELWIVTTDAHTYVSDQTLTADVGQMLTDLGMIKNYTAYVCNIARNFKITSHLDGVYNDGRTDSTVTVTGSEYVFSTILTRTFDSGATYEYVRVDVTIDLDTGRWLVVSYRGGTDTTAPSVLWFKQEGDVIGDSYYIATSYHVEEYADVADLEPLRISNLIFEDTNSTDSIQMALESSDCIGDCVVLGTTTVYTDGVEAADLNTWTNFRTYNMTGEPDYEIP